MAKRRQGSGRSKAESIETTDAEQHRVDSEREDRYASLPEVKPFGVAHKRANGGELAGTESGEVIALRLRLSELEARSEPRDAKCALRQMRELVSGIQRSEHDDHLDAGLETIAWILVQLERPTPGEIERHKEAHRVVIGMPGQGEVGEVLKAAIGLALEEGASVNDDGEAAAYVAGRLAQLVPERKLAQREILAAIQPFRSKRGRGRDSAGPAQRSALQSLLVGLGLEARSTDKNNANLAKNLERGRKEIDRRSAEASRVCPPRGRPA